jgi:hypothetical protein
MSERENKKCLLSWKQMIMENKKEEKTKKSGESGRMG